MAAARRTERDLAEMEKIIESDELKDSDTVISDISFHQAVARASGNEMLSLFMSSIHMTVRTLAERYILPEAKQVSQRQHRQIYQAILEQDEPLAKSRMQEHLQFASEVYRKAIPRTAEGVPDGGSSRPGVEVD
jgi:GntR family transcriptional regulator, transcriptional repressor for pyruvate dehydrogenase complex